MKRFATPSLMTACCLILASVWTDHQGLTFRANTWGLRQDSKRKTFFKARGNVLVTSLTDGLQIEAEEIDFEALPKAKDSKAFTITHALASRKVKITKSVSTPKSKQTTVITGPKMDYSTTPTESIVKMMGPTTINNLEEIQRQRVIATGSSGIAYLDPSSRVANGNGFRKAILQGPVKLILTKAKTKDSPESSTTATASHMEFENLPGIQKVTLVGAVHIVGSSTGDVSGLSRAILILDQNDQWHLDASGGK